MKTAVVGPAGSGKSFLFGEMKGNYINVDSLVDELYKTDEVIEWFVVTQHLNKAINNDATMNKGRLLGILIEHLEAREKLEDFLFSIIKKKIDEVEKSFGDVIVDGIMPRFVAYFDRVIYIEMREEDRFNNLVKRGVPQDRAQKLVELQRGMFHNLLPERI